MELAVDNKVLEFVADFQKPETVSKVRTQALEALKGMDFPTTRVEEWKYTRVAKFVKRKYNQLQKETDVQEYRIADLEAHVLVFVNGYYDEKQSVVLQDDALTIESIDELDEAYYADVMEDMEENVFSLINKAYSTGGVAIHIKENTKAKPIHIMHVLEGEGVIANARHYIHAGKGSKAEVILTFDSNNSANSFTNIVVEGQVETNANLSIVKVQTEDKDVFHISNELFVQDESSDFGINTVTTGGLLTRNGLDVIVEGEHCHTEMNGVYLGVENQHIDNHTLIDQLYSNCTSSEAYKGVMDGKSSGVFNGKVIVREDAQKIEAYQSNKNILLSKGSSINSKPELEIYADDVRCSHGCTIGELDEEAVYYLKSRGISDAKARQLLVSAFIGDLLDNIENESVRKHIDRTFLKDFGWEF